MIVFWGNDGLVKIYTRTGDVGETGLLGGRRVPKHSPRVEAYGTVDEMNAAIGVARTFLDDVEVDGVLARIQESLFVVGSDLAAPLNEEKPATVPRVSSDHVEDLEELIDRYQAELPRLRHFVVPGGHRAAALLHLARTVCRRAERRVAALADQEPINDHLVAYLNRLGDLLFILARLVNHRAGVAEHTWHATGAGCGTQPLKSRSAGTGGCSYGLEEPAATQDA